MRKSVRSVAIELHKNREQILAWRATLTEKQRGRLIHPLSNVRRWRAATTSHRIAADDAFQTATTAWRRFLAAAETLPAKQALPLWQEIHEKAESRIYTRPILDPLSLRT